MNYYNNIGAELAKGIDVSFGADEFAFRKVINIRGVFDVCMFDQYMRQVYGSEFSSKTLDHMTYFNSGNSVPATYYVFEIFRNIFLEYNQENPSLSDYQPKNYLKHSKELEANIKEIRNKLETICKFSVSETQTDFSAIDTYLNFIDSRLNEN